MLRPLISFFSSGCFVRFLGSEEFSIPSFLLVFLVFFVVSSLLYRFLLFSKRKKSSNSVERSLVQLSSDIELVYNDLRENISFSLSRYRLALIHQKIQTSSYILSPLKVKFVKKSDITSFLRETLDDSPDIMLGACLDSDFITVVMPDNKEDALVLMGLSITLIRLSLGRLPQDGYRIADDLSTFYSSLQSMGKVDRLYKLDLMRSLKLVPITPLLDKVKHLVGDGGIYKLIQSFLNLPILDSNGNHHSSISGIPPVGEITRIFFNIFLMDAFDREFEKRFPGIAFSR